MQFKRFWPSVLVIGALFSAPLYADLDTSMLQNASTAATTTETKREFDSLATAFLNAIVFSTLQSQGRTKLPGYLKAYTEFGFNAYRVRDERLQDASTSSPPDFFNSVFLKGGTGLPFGFAVEGGFSQLVNDKPITVFYGTLSNQILDLANDLYVDMVPTITLSATAMKTVVGPQIVSLTGQSVIGAYHRQSFIQFGLIAQYTFAYMQAVAPSVRRTKARFGLMSSFPLYEGLFLRTEIFYPSMSLLGSLGWQF